MKKMNLLIAGLLVAGTLSMAVAESTKTESTPKANMGQQSEKPVAKKKQSKNVDASKGTPAKEKKAMYKCEHCPVTSDKPGKCSMCYMDLKKI